MAFIQDQYRHCKSILALGASSALLDKADVKLELAGGEPDPGVFKDAGNGASVKAFIKAIGMHRHPTRETDSPLL